MGTNMCELSPTLPPEENIDTTWSRRHHAPMRTTIVQLFLVMLFLGRTSFALGAGRAAGAELFTNGPVLKIQITLDERAIQELRSQPREDVFGTLEENGKIHQDVAIHLKGAVGSFRPIDDGKPAFTVSFNKKDKKQRFHGLRKIHLNNSVQDPVYIDEQFCGELFRNAGVPAARTTHAVVTLNGRRLGGVYVVKEGFNDEFLSQYFTQTNGNLYDGGFLKDIDQPIEKSSGKGPDDHSDLKKVVAAIRESNGSTRWQKLNELVEVDRFVTMMVIEAITVHWDGYSAKANNYRVYVNPENGKLVFLVHGMDQMFGRMSDFRGTVYPFTGGLVAHAVLSTREGKALYEEKLRHVFSRHFNPADIQKMLARMYAPVEMELKSNPGRYERYRHEKADHQKRVMERIRLVSDQLQKGRFHQPRFEESSATIDYWVGSGMLKDLEDLKMQQRGNHWEMSIAAKAKPSSAWKTRLQLEKGKYRLQGRTNPGNGAGQGLVRVYFAGKEIGKSLAGADGTFSLAFEANNPRNDIEFQATASDSSKGASFDLSAMKLTRLPTVGGK